MKVGLAAERLQVERSKCSVTYYMTGAEAFELTLRVLSNAYPDSQDCFTVPIILFSCVHSVDPFGSTADNRKYAGGAGNLKAVLNTLILSQGPQYVKMIITARHKVPDRNYFVIIFDAVSPKCHARIKHHISITCKIFFCRLYVFLSSSLNGKVVRASVSNAVYDSNLGTCQRLLKNDVHSPPALHSAQTGGGKATNLLIVTLGRALNKIFLFGRPVVGQRIFSSRRANLTIDLATS